MVKVGEEVNFCPFIFNVKRYVMIDNSIYIIPKAFLVKYNVHFRIYFGLKISTIRLTRLALIAVFFVIFLV